MMIRALICTALTTVSSTAMAFDCAEINDRLEQTKRPLSEIRDRCPDSFVEVETEEGWITVDAGEEACFIETDNRWKWRCRSQEVSEQCRVPSSFDESTDIGVKLDFIGKGTVEWFCLDLSQ